MFKCIALHVLVKKNVKDYCNIENSLHPASKLRNDYIIQSFAKVKLMFCAFLNDITFYYS